MSSPPPLTDSEMAILRRDGEFVMKNFIPLTFATVAWSAYLIITYQATCILCKNGIRNSRPRKILLATTILMFLLSTTQMIAFFGEFLVQVKHILLETDPTLKERIARSAGLRGRFTLTNTILIQFQVLLILKIIYCLTVLSQAILGDSIVVWRTWAIWSKRNRVIILPSVLWVLSCVTLIVTSVLQSRIPSPPIRIMIITQATSAATNTVATGLISYKAWRHRRLLRSTFGRSTLATTQISQILVLLVESGWIYLGIWLLDIIIGAVAITTYGPWLIAADTIDYVISQALGIYPTVIILLVENQKTVWDDPAVSHVISALQFGSGSRSQPDSDHTRSASQSNLHDVSDIREGILLGKGEKNTKEVVSS